MDSARILLIGDEPNILRTLRRNLTGRGYQVQIAFDDQEVFEIAPDSGFDLFILDLDFQVPQVEGLKICRQLRKLSHAPIIVLSNIGSENVKIEALSG